MTQHNQINKAWEAVREAQKWVESAKSDPNNYMESQNHLMIAEEQVTNAYQQSTLQTEKDLHQLTKATDLLKFLQETQQSINQK